ncbi:MAG TPA: RDD family protein, partial [Acidimicrobiales bacterium]|nr:RDD family protein [Acidimicrobiales bacterium]
DRQSVSVNRPPAGRRLAAVLIDLALVVVAAPVLLIAIGVALSWLLYLPVSGDCADPCDGPAMAAFAIAAIVVLAMSILYWPVLVYWRRRTVGSRIVGLRFEGCGIRRYFAWDAGRPAEAR